MRIRLKLNKSYKYYVYSLCYPDGIPFYIGKGCGRRMHHHEQDTCYKGNKHKIHIINKIKRNGGKVLKNVLFRTNNEKLAYNKEIGFIKCYGRKDLKTGILCNLSDGGGSVLNMSERHRQSIIQSNKIRTVTEDTKNKIRNSLLGKKLSDQHKRNIGKGGSRSMTPERRLSISKQFKGIPKTKEHNKKNSDALKGRKFSKEHRKNLSEALRGKVSSMLGRKHSEETKRKISISHKGKFTGRDNPFYGKKHSEETKQKISIANKGRKRSAELINRIKEIRKNNPYKHSKEAKLKISKANKGRRFSTIHKENISKAKIRYWATP